MKIQHLMALVVLSLATVPGARAAVLAGPITNAANAHTYYLLSHTNWAASEAEARQLGGHLVTINDAAENQWILNTFSPLTGVSESRLWIGLNDVANEGQFVWASGEPVTFTDWYPGEPSNSGPGGEDYAAIIQSIFAPPDGRWLDITDQFVSPFVRTFGIVEVPVVVTQPADQFMPGSARLKGLANPNGSPILAWFEWGTSLAYGNVTPPQFIGSGSNVVGFSNVLVGLVSGTEYHFRARGSNAVGLAAGQDQAFNLNIQRPGVTTLAADQLAPTSARLNGQANPCGWPTVAWFEWGTSPAYGNATPPQSVGSGLNAVGISNVLAGLVNGTEYHFRAVASNAFGLAAGLDQTFYLANLRPVVTTLAADQLSSTNARLRGQVNPRGWPTAAWFEWGTNATYGNVIGMQDVGQAASVSNLNVVLNGLMIGPNYRYRLVATNVFGAAYGADQTFNLYPPPITKTWTGADPSGYWSAPGNWFPAGVPANGDDLVFPGGLPPGDMVSTNDLADSIFRSIRFQAGGHTIRGNPITLMNRNDVIVNSGTNVIACDLTFTGTPSIPNYQFPSIRGFPGELTVIGNVGGGSLYVSIQQLVIRGQFTGGSIRVTYGSLALLGDNPHPVSAVIQGTTYNTLRVLGSQPNLNITMLLEMEVPSCPTLTGDGVVGDVTVCGTITPDSTLSVKNFGGQGAANWRVLNIRLNGTNVGEYGKLVASGDLNLGMVRLLPSPSFNPQAGQVFTIVEKTSPGAIANAPFGPEGTVTNLNGMPFRISYVGGDGNDVTLTANTPPVVTWQQPANNAAFPPGFTISLRARATDSDGTVTNVDFFATPTNGPAINVGQGTLASDGYYVRGWTNPPPGQYQLHAEAVDNAGGWGISGSVQIVVVDTSQPPTNAQTRTWTGADPSGNWSAPANWSPAGVLVNGDALVFPGGLPPGDMMSTNDLTDRIFRSITFNQDSRHTIRGNPMTLTNRANVIINDGTNVIACDLTFSGTPPLPTTGNPSIWSSSFGSTELTVIGNVGGGNLKVAVGFGRVVIRGQFTGGSLFVDWYSTLALYGDNPYAVSADVSGSTLLVEGSQPNLNIRMYWNMEAQTPAILSGDGLVGDVTGLSSSTRITPDSTLSVKNISGPVSLLIRLNGTNVGEYGKLVASGNVSLTGGSLTPSPGFNPQPGQIFTIVEKTSPGPIANAIFGPEGKITTLNGMPFRISYVGGDGNDVTLTVVTPVPIVLGAVQQFGPQFVFSYSADVGLRYAVERSATLSNWTPIWSNTANVNPMTFTDTVATNRMNFYRVRRLPNP